MNSRRQSSYHSTTKDTCERELVEMLQKVAEQWDVFEVRGNIFNGN